MGIMWFFHKFKLIITEPALLRKWQVFPDKQRRARTVRR